MSRKARSSDQVDPVEKDFDDALGRLLSGKPTHPRLLDDLKRRVLRITPTSVALEAGHSRTLIGYEGCKYPLVRARVFSHKPKKDEDSVHLQDIVMHKRHENAELKMQLRKAQTHNAALIIELEKSQLRQQKLQRNLTRLKRKLSEEAGTAWPN
ncbi:hypothetical protein ACSFBM_19190 [Variovorax sp. GB1R11]|uniref:hypothetical protein n=1 Tax=Variovorax sp. GB1R11 TaxID=3443741 RepID=UPI003F472748